MSDFFEKVSSQEDPFKKLAFVHPRFQRLYRKAEPPRCRQDPARHRGAPLRGTLEARIQFAGGTCQQRHDQICGRYGKSIAPPAHLHRQDQHGRARIFRDVRRSQDQRKGTRSHLSIRSRILHSRRSGRAVRSIMWKPVSAMKPPCPPPFAISQPWPALPWKPSSAALRLLRETGNNFNL